MPENREHKLNELRNFIFKCDEEIFTQQNKVIARKALLIENLIYEFTTHRLSLYAQDGKDPYK